MRRLFCATGLLLAAGCVVDLPLAVGTCDASSDCRPGRSCLEGRCYDPGFPHFHFRQWVDGFDGGATPLAGCVAYVDGGSLVVSLPTGVSPRGGYAQISNDQRPFNSEGKIAGRVTFTSPTAAVSGTSAHLMNIDMDEGPSPRAFINIVVLTNGKLALAGEVIPGGSAVESSLTIARKSYFIELGWRLGERAVLLVDNAEVLSVAIDAGASSFPSIFRARIGFQNYTPATTAPPLAAVFSSWQVTEGIDDPVGDHR